MRYSELFEYTRTGKHYRDNPEAITKYDIRAPGGNKEGYQIYPDDSRYQQFLKKFEEKWKPRMKGVENRRGEITPTGWGIDDLVKYDTWEEAKESYDFRDTEINAATEAFFSKYYQELKRDVTAQKKMQKHTQRKGAYTSNVVTKKAQQIGLSSHDYRTVMEWIDHFTSMSGKKIPKEIWPALRKLTVNPNSLPKVVYRGIFYDGAKIKDPAKWAKKWYEGSHPKLRNRKATSWSTSIAVATHFMDAQDMVKNKETGYAMLLKYEINDPDLVIADMRNLPENTFWSQQEILLSPDAIDYEVMKMIPYKEGKWDKTALYKFQKKHGKPFAGGHGSKRSEMLKRGFFEINNLEISANLKEQWRTYKDKTAKEVKKLEKMRSHWNENIEEVVENTLFPLYSFMTTFSAGYFSVHPVERINEKSIKFVVIFQFDNKQYGKEYKPTDKYKLLVDIMQPEDKMDMEDTVPYGTTAKFNATLELVNNDFNNFEFKMSNFGPVTISGFQDKEIKVDKLEKALNGSHADQFFDMFKQSTASYDSGHKNIRITAER